MDMWLLGIIIILYMGLLVLSLINMLSDFIPQLGIRVGSLLELTFTFQGRLLVDKMASWPPSLLLLSLLS